MPTGKRPVDEFEIPELAGRCAVSINVRPGGVSFEMYEVNDDPDNVLSLVKARTHDLGRNDFHSVEAKATHMLNIFSAMRDEYIVGGWPTAICVKNDFSQESDPVIQRMILSICYGYQCALGVPSAKVALTEYAAGGNIHARIANEFDIQNINENTENEKGILIVGVFGYTPQNEHVCLELSKKIMEAEVNNHGTK